MGLMNMLFKLFLAFIEAKILVTIINWPGVGFLVGDVLGIRVSLGSLTMIFLLMNYISAIGAWLRTAKGQATGMIESAVGHSRFLLWGVYLIILALLRINGAYFGFPLKFLSIGPIKLWKVFSYIGLASSRGYVTIISFTKENIHWGYILLGVGIFFFLLSQWQKIRAKRAKEGGGFSLLGMLKRGPKVGANEAGLDKSLYAALGRVSPLIEYEYRGVILKIGELTAKQDKGKRIDYKLLSDLKESKQDIEDEIIEYITMKNKKVIHPKAFKDLQLSEDEKAQAALQHIVRITLPRARKYQKMKEREVGIR